MRLDVHGVHVKFKFEKDASVDQNIMNKQIVKWTKRQVWRMAITKSTENEENEQKKNELSFE